MRNFLVGKKNLGPFPISLICRYGKKTKLQHLHSPHAPLPLVPKRALRRRCTSRLRSPSSRPVPMPESRHAADSISSSSSPSSSASASAGGGGMPNAFSRTSSSSSFLIHLSSSSLMLPPADLGCCCCCWSGFRPKGGGYCSGGTWRPRVGKVRAVSEKSSVEKGSRSSASDGSGLGLGSGLMGRGEKKVARKNQATRAESVALIQKADVKKRKEKMRWW